MPVTVDERSYLDDQLDAIERLYYRHRHLVAPPLAAAVLWASSALVWSTPTSWGMWPFGLYCLFFACWLFFDAAEIVHTTERVPLWGRDEPGETKNESRIFNTKVVVAFGWGYAAVWSLVQAWFGPSTTTLYFLLVFLVPAWVYWSTSRTIRRGVEVFRDIEKWDGDAVGLPEVSMVTSGAKGAEDGSWWEAPLKAKVKGKVTAKMLRQAIPRMAARYGYEENEISIEVPKPGKFLFRYTKVDPEEPVHRFQPPPDGYKIGDLATIGLWDDDGSPMQFAVYIDDHGMIDAIHVGAKGSGKSNALEIKAVHVIAAEDAVPWAIDMKPGAQQFGSYAPVLDWLATTAAEADRMIRALLCAQQVRGAVPGRIVKPSKKRPAIVVLCDEFSLLWLVSAMGGKERMDAVREVAARIAAWETWLATSRSFAMGALVALQRAMEDNTGSSDIRGHLTGGESMIFRTSKNADARLAVDLTEEDYERMKPSELPRSRPGTCFVKNRENDEPRKGRVFQFTEADRDAIIARYRGTNPTLEPEVVEAMGEDYANRQRTVTGRPLLEAVPDATDDGETVPEVESGTGDGGDGNATPKRLSKEDSLVHFWRATLRFGARGGKVGQVAAAAVRHDSTTRAALTELVEMGCATKAGSRYIADGTAGEVRAKHRERG